MKAKGQGHTDVMNVCDILSYGNTLLCQMSYDYVKGQKRCGLNTKQCQKSYKFDLQVKGKLCIGITNVRNSSSHGSPMCQI